MKFRWHTNSNNAKFVAEFYRSHLILLQSVAATRTDNYMEVLKRNQQTMTPTLLGEKRYNEQTNTSRLENPPNHPSSSNETALLTLALRLLERREPGTLASEATQLLVGQLPTLPVEIPLPQSSRILGSLIRSDKQIAIVLDTDGDPEEILDFYRDRLQADGWKIPESYRLGSFEPAHATNYLLFCGGSLALWVEAYRVQNSVTGVRLQLEMNPRHSPCNRLGECDRA